MSSSRNNKSSNPDSNESWEMLIGEITAPHGLQGEVRVFAHTDFPDRFLDLTRVGLQRGKELIGFAEIKYARVTKQRIVLKLVGIDTIQQSESLRGVQLVIPQSWARDLGKDEYYHHQLLGLDVYTTSGEALGKILEIWPSPANDVYETPLALIPATKDMIREIDLAHGRMIVDARPGLKKDEPGD